MFLLFPVSRIQTLGDALWNKWAFWANKVTDIGFSNQSKHAIQPPIDFSTYKAWLSSQDPVPSQPATSAPNSTTDTNTPIAVEVTTLASSSTSVTAEPSYPSSFAHIVELITTGQPIPGIQQIPETVLTGKEAPSAATKRRKPWEKEGDDTGEGSSPKNEDDDQGVGK
jgi:hypothetical protein